MPLVLKRKIENNTIIGVWEISESSDMLRKHVCLDEKEEKTYSDFLTENRKKHWLSCRSLLSEMIGEEKAKIEYDKNGKPHLYDMGCNISLTHAGDYAAAIISSRYLVGIDIEKVTPRIDKIKQRFLGEKEITHLEKDYKLEELYIYWGAKEAIYKLYGKKNLDFKNEIMIEKVKPQAKGVFKGVINKGDMKEQFMLSYETIGNYILVYLTGELKNF